MKSILINPKDTVEFELLVQLLDRMKISSKVLSAEEQEDFGMGILMKQADRTKKVSRETIMEKLNL